MAGKKNPKSMANLKPFQPGQSGNPAGAPKGKRWRTIISEIMDMPAVLTAGDRDQKVLEIFEKRLGRDLTNRDVIIVNQLQLARTKPNAARLIMDREEGRPAVEDSEKEQGGSYLDFLDAIPGGDDE